MPPSGAPRIGFDGRYVVFESLATTLVAGDTNQRRDVFLRDVQLSTTTRVSVATSGAQSDRDATAAEHQRRRRSRQLPVGCDYLDAGPDPLACDPALLACRACLRAHGRDLDDDASGYSRGRFARLVRRGGRSGIG